MKTPETRQEVHSFHAKRRLLHSRRTTRTRKGLGRRPGACGRLWRTKQRRGATRGAGGGRGLAMANSGEATAGGQGGREVLFRVQASAPGVGSLTFQPLWI